MKLIALTTISLLYAATAMAHTCAEHHTANLQGVGVQQHVTQQQAMQQQAMQQQAMQQQAMQQQAVQQQGPAVSGQPPGQAWGYPAQQPIGNVVTRTAAAAKNQAEVEVQYEARRRVSRAFGKLFGR